jgi:hypothetical protein
MVRIKERYLLVSILYPDALDTRTNIPDLVLVNQPTTDELTPGALLRAIRAEVATLFGDYGSGQMEGGNLAGKSTPQREKAKVHVLTRHSQIPLDCHLYTDPQGHTVFLPASMGRTDFYDSRPGQKWQGLHVSSCARQRYYSQSGRRGYTPLSVSSHGCPTGRADWEERRPTGKSIRSPEKMRTPSYRNT